MLKDSFYLPKSFWFWREKLRSLRREIKNLQADMSRIKEAINRNKNNTPPSEPKGVDPQKWQEFLKEWEEFNKEYSNFQF